MAGAAPQGPGGGPGGILSHFTRHPTLANLLLVLMLVAGLVSFPNMRAQFFPDVVVDDVTVSVAWTGAGAEDVDSGIVQVLEPALLAVEGVEGTEATSREGRASIRVDFEPGWEMSRAADDVQTAVDQITELPEEAEEPEVRRGAWRDRVTDVVITGPVGVDQIARYADELVARLFEAGVTRTTIRGLAAPETVVEVEQAALIAHDLTMRDIASAIAAEVDASPAGDVASATTRVRTGRETRGAEEIADIVLRSDPSGADLTIGQVASVRVEGAARERSYFVGDDPAMSVRVDRSARGDAIAMQRTVEEVAADLRATLPEDVSVDLIRTRADYISGRLDILIDNGLMGLGLVVLLLFLFLNARTAFWVAAGIPTAMFATVALMYAGGLTINMISLFALIITLGIVVDDAIVVGEHADHRHRTLGEPPVVAAENAARRMAMPVFAATLTTVFAFFSLVAIGGRFGDLIADIPFTVIAVLLASLVECFLILPNHMAHALKSSDREHWYDWPSRQVNRGFAVVRDRLFRPAMRGVIRARYVVLAGVVAILASQVALVVSGDVSWRFFNAPERSSVTGNFAMATGATRADSLEQMAAMQRAVEEVAADYAEEHGRNPVDYVLAEVGGNAGWGMAGAETKEPDQLGGISIELIDADLRPYSAFAFVGALQERVERHPMAETVTFRGFRSGPGGDALDVQFHGASAGTLKAAAEDLKTAVARFPEVSGVEDDLPYDKEELILELTAQGHALGLSAEGLGRVLRDRLGGIEAATYPAGPRSAAIRVELPEDALKADFMDRMQLRTPEGAYVPLADVVSVERRTGFSTVRRENGLRVVSVTGDIDMEDAARTAEIRTALEEEILPAIAAERQVNWRVSGLSEQESEFLADAVTGLLLCLTGIYLALAWIFGSWTRPFVVMAVIPFGLVGAIWGHNAWGVPLSMFSVVGLLGMTGIIVNDSIVLMTTIAEKARTRGLAPAIVDGAADRLRPVLLTTATTVLGLTPLLYEGSSQAEFLKPTVITLVYGLGFGMVLVLLVVPALLAAQTDLGRLVRAFRRGLRFRARGARTGLRLGALASLAWLAATLGWTAVTGALTPPIADLMPGLAAAPPMAAALAAYLAGAAVVALAAALAVRLVTRPGRRAA
ncbi:efflux RND transporter permease subunit [Rhodosalinus sp.]|uniref:efflux RND transporter permease subunit n=1 Tax=Rhodosalinus sp. TaxID=2047741 RepID=UPI0035658ADB